MDDLATRTRRGELVASYARTVRGLSGETLPPEQWQRVEDHLAAVAVAARTFSAKFGGGDWAWLAGLWHDLDKFHPDFQQMLLDVSQGLRKRGACGLKPGLASTPPARMERLD